MKNFKYLYILLSLGLVLWSCDQALVDIPVDNDFTPVDPGDPPSAGTADFTKYVAVGSSLTAGFQANALFDDGQLNSMPNILSQQFAQVGGGDFIQPIINSVNGFNSTDSDLSDPDPNNWVIKGRLLLVGSIPTATDSDLGAVPSPIVNPGFVYTGDPINNFGVHGILLGQALIPETGDWTLANIDPRFNPFYARFASNPGVSTIIGDAATSGGTFFSLWLGTNDVLLHAVTGASGIAPFTSEGDFSLQFGAALTVMTTDPDIQGVVGNIPDVASVPFFTLVPWNSIPLDDLTAAAVNAAFQEYNDGLDVALGLGLISAEENAARKISFAGVADNAVLVEDESLTQNVDISAFFSLPPGSVVLPNLRQTTADDLLTLPAAAVLGTLADPNNPLSVIGVAVPLGDSFTLLADELAEVEARTDAFNTIIAGTIAGLGVGDRVALADVNAAFNDLVTGPQLQDGVAVAATLAPPAGVFSEDGAHPNSRGYAIAANVFIEAINDKFGANVPRVNVAQFAGTALPQ